MKTCDVIVIGGGIIGLSLSIALRKKGASVLVVERGEPGHEASRAAGGMLVDCGVETPAALQTLATASAAMYPEFARELQVESGIDVDLRDYGTILFLSSLFLSSSATNADVGTRLSGDRMAQLEPSLIAGDRPAVYLQERSIDPRALTAAAWKTAKNRGVDFSSGNEVVAVNLSDDRVTGVTTTKTGFLSPKVVNCAGAWGGSIGPYAIPTRPVKGQMLCLAMHPRDLLKHVVRSPDVYLIPRSDGRLLIGATVEEAGFDKRTDAATIKRLYQAALALLPKLADSRILEDWAGLRPGTPDGLPILGATATPGYYVATGHFRDGILLAPITAKIMAEVVNGKNSGYDLKAFSASRFSQPTVAT
ncbi:MAG TPA: glycine oxidase ThiO, partial [Candidatus Sulfotelmatobacter sp.]|nr:glycine oxidase ThiO [Candidatus Sulfotelmatobacter sp.]